MVIVITGIIGGMVAVFLKAPVQQYMDVARRADMTDIADTALRRLGRDIRTAVPNSVRLSNPSGSTYFLEFLPTKAGGRYREAASPANACAGIPGVAGGDALSFEAADTCFEILGPTITFAAGDQIVVGSTQSDGNPPYLLPTSATGIRRAYDNVNGAVGVGVQRVVVTSNTVLPASAELESHRFAVVPGDQQAVTYACENVGVANGEGTGRLNRYWNYGIIAAQPTPPAAVPSVLADRISGCNIVYDVVNQRNGLVAIWLEITRGGESISLYHEIHVHNSP